MAGGLDSRKAAVVEVLNQARAAELAAILQYMSQHYELADRDYGPLAAPMKLIAIDEMRHAEMLAERILVIGGVPTSERDRKAIKGKPVADIFALGIALEEQALRDYNEFLHVCQKNNDYVSAKVFEQLIAEEQMHLEHFQDIQAHIAELGNAYLATQTGGPAEAGPPARGFVASQGGAPAAAPA